MPALLLSVFIDTVGFGIVLPLLPFFAERFGATPLTVTLLASIYSLAQFIFAPVWGRLSDRWGRRPVLLLTIGGTAAGYLWLAFGDSLLVLFLARAATGAMAANTAVVQAYVSDVTSTADRARGMGRIGAAHGLGFVLGPAIGGLFAGADPAAPNLALPFLFAAGLSALALGIAVFGVSETVSAEQRRAATVGGLGRIAMFADAVRRPGLAALLILLTMTPFVFSGVESIFVLWSEHQLGWGPRQNGWIYTFMGAVAVSVQWLLVGRMAKRFGEVRMIRLGAVLIGAGVMVLPFMSGPAGLCAAFGLIVSGVCINNPCLSSLISQHAAAEERGALLGVSQTCSTLARIVGPAWSGFAFGALGPSWPFFSGALVMAVMLALALRLAASRPASGQS
ncbi:MAG: MFS transporter [Alphaproteobacteria bacterium]